MENSKHYLLGYIAEKKDEVRRRYAARREEIGELSAKTVGDYGDAVRANEARRIGFALAERELLRFRMLEDAERRLIADDYRRCERCDKYIEIARVCAIPETTLCYDCSEEMGRKSRVSTRDQGSPRGISSGARERS